ncbi:type I secretion system permease/ATPase [Arsukibacterium sp.]|uniref:type I secretion system permease/ATPase n=1 Tax=Arsukibacterium sp. TaxID=1977258 RepID=UPI002FD97F47
MQVTTKPSSAGPLFDAFKYICQYHSIYINADSLLNGLPLENGQLSPLALERAAKRAGLSCKIMQNGFAGINPALLPAIVLNEDNQPIILHQINLDNTVTISYAEDAETAFTEPTKLFAERISNTVFYLRPALSAKVDNIPKTLLPGRHWFWGVISQNQLLYKDVILASILINLFALATPLFVMNVYDRVVPNSAIETLWVLAAGITLVFALDLILKLLRHYFVDLAASRTDIKLSAIIMDKVLGMQLESKPKTTGSFAASIQGFESVRSFSSSMTLVSLVDLPFVLLYLVFIILINPWLALPIIIGGLLIVLYGFIVQHQLAQLSENAMQVSSEKNASLIEGLSALETIKSFGLQSFRQKKWEQLSLLNSHNTAKIRAVSTSVSTVSSFLQQLSSIAIIILGVYLIIDGQLTQGGLIAVYLLSSRTLAPVTQAAGLLAQFNQASTAINALDELMQKPSESDCTRKKVAMPKLIGSIEFKKVSFKYPDTEYFALQDVSFKIQPGEHIAIIGKNGSGKTTVNKLIQGLYKPTSGQILIDGVDLQMLDLVAVRKQIGYVPQDITLFRESLRFNIELDTPADDDSHLLKAIQQSGVQHIIEQQAAGLELNVGEYGQHLSGGQRQSVALARAMFKQPAILLLDEPTAALDHASEEAVKQSLLQGSTDKTLIVVTHRSPLLTLANRLIVMDKGKVVADGPKDNVLEALRQGRVVGA